MAIRVRSPGLTARFKSFIEKESQKESLGEADVANGKKEEIRGNVRTILRVMILLKELLTLLHCI